MESFHKTMGLKVADLPKGKAERAFAVNMWANLESVIDDINKAIENGLAKLEANTKKASVYYRSSDDEENEGWYKHSDISTSKHGRTK